MQFQSFKFVNTIIFTVYDIIIFRQLMDLVKKNSWFSFSFLGIRVFPFINFSSSISIRFEKGVISLIQFLQYQACQFFGGLCMFSYRGYCIVYVPTNYTYHSKQSHDFLQQVSHKLDKEIEQSFYPLSSFSIAFCLGQNVLIETSCNNNSNKNDKQY